MRRAIGDGPIARIALPARIAKRHARVLGAGDGPRAMTREREVVLCAGVRTPRGKGSPRGALHGVTPVRLVAGLLDALVAHGVVASAIDDVILGCATQIDAQGGNLARAATLLAGWDARVPGVTINRFCASGLDAINLATARVRAGDADIIVAGGVESVSRVPVFGDRGPLFTDADVMARAGSIHMGSAADLVATLDGVTREQLDDYAEATRAKAREAWDSGVAASSVVPIVGAGGELLLARDELLAGAPSRDELAALPPLFADRPDDDAIVLARYPHAAPLRHLHTRGSSPALADAVKPRLRRGSRSAGVAERAGLAPRARRRERDKRGRDPVIMLTAGQAAAVRALDRAGVAARDVEVFDRRGIRRAVPAPDARARHRPRSPQRQRRHDRARPRIRRDRRDPRARPCRRRARAPRRDHQRAPRMPSSRRRRVSGAAGLGVATVFAALA